MTHMRQMSETEGKLDEGRLVDRICRKCGAQGNVLVQTWESNDGAYEDEKYTCRACGHVWWVEGIDS